MNAELKQIDDELNELNKRLIELRRRKKEILQEAEKIKNEKRITTIRERNLAIVNMRKKGASYREIAEHLGIAIDTVSNVFHFEGDDYDLYELSSSLRNTIMWSSDNEIKNKKTLIEKLKSKEGLYLFRGISKARIYELSSFVGFELDAVSYVEHNPTGFDEKRMIIKIKSEI